MPSLPDALGLSVPIIQAPMAGGGDTPELVAAVSNRGGLGSVGAAYLTAEQIAATAARVRALTDRPFAINLFAEPPAGSPTGPLALPEDPIDPAIWTALAAAHEPLGLQAPRRPAALGPALDAQITAALESGAAVLSFTFGILPPAAIAAARDRGMGVIGTATTPVEAVALAQAGVDAVVAQGAEAGGHRGTFLHPIAEAMIGTMALVPRIVDAVSVPVIASGGIMDGRGIAAARALGAAWVQLGTVFLTVPRPASRLPTRPNWPARTAGTRGSPGPIPAVPPAASPIASWRMSMPWAMPGSPAFPCRTRSPGRCAPPPRRPAGPSTCPCGRARGSVWRPRPCRLPP